MNLVPEIYIISVYQKNCTDKINLYRHGNLLNGLKSCGINVKECIGKFGDNEEKIYYDISY